MRVGGAILAGACPLGPSREGCCMLRTLRHGLSLTSVARTLLPLLLLALVAAVALPAAAFQTPQVIVLPGAKSA